jgi:hypothetical protein
MIATHHHHHALIIRLLAFYDAEQRKKHAAFVCFSGIARKARCRSAHHQNARVHRSN